MATYTAGDQINRALRLLGVLAEGETPSAETSADALMALNQMLDSWSTERLSVYATLEQVVTWPSGQAVRTLGPSGNLPGTNVRPVAVEDSTFYRDAEGTDHPVQIISEAEYNTLSDKTVTGDPYLLVVNPTHPNIELTVYPVPSRALDWHIVSPQVLTEVATLATVFALPPGYLRALTYNLAMELAPEFGVEPSPQVQRIAMVSKRDLKRLNESKDVMSFPPELVGRGTYNIFEG